jgi:hypothetical protein
MGADRLCWCGFSRFSGCLLCSLGVPYRCPAAFRCLNRPQKKGAGACVLAFAACEWSGRRWVSDESAEPLLGGAVSSHPVAVDTQGEARVGVPKLIHDVACVDAESDEDRGEGVAQLVGRQAFGQRRFPCFDQLLVGVLDRLVEYATANVALGELGACGAGKDIVVWGAVGALRLVPYELIAQHGQEVYFPCAGVCLGFKHDESIAGGIDMAPAQVGQLTDAQSGEHERCQERSPVYRTTLLVASSFGLGLRIECARGYE